MNISETGKKLNAKIITENADSTLQITGVYICDLLSRAMSKLNEGNLWITIQNNVNTIAVASLTEASAVIFPEGIIPEDEVIAAAQSKNVVIMITELSAYEICKALSEYI